MDRPLNTYKGGLGHPPILEVTEKGKPGSFAYPRLKSGFLEKSVKVSPCVMNRFILKKNRSVFILLHCRHYLPCNAQIAVKLQLR